MVSTAKPTKRERRLGIRAIPKLDKYVARRPYPPGVHGQRRKGSLSDYGLQLQEKQRLKFIYGLRERQLSRLFELDPSNILVTLERRLDNVVFRGGLAKTRAQARQMISHGHIKVNDKKVTIPSYLIKEKEVVSVRNPDKLELQDVQTPDWLQVDKKKKIISVKKLPPSDDITSEINEQLIIEYYSR